MGWRGEREGARGEGGEKERGGGGRGRRREREGWEWEGETDRETVNRCVAYVYAMFQMCYVRIRYVPQT